MTLPTWVFVLICIVGALLVIALIIAVCMAVAFGKMAAGFMGGIVEGLGGPRMFPRKDEKRR